MKNKSELCNINGAGELMFNLSDDIAKRYKPDSVFEKPAAPYIIMAICAFVDAFFFFSLFSSISYESPLLLIFEIVGCLVGLDLLPVYLGNQYKRYKQGYKVDKALLRVALSVVVLTCLVNLVLRIAVAVMSVQDVSSASKYLETTAAMTEAAQTAGISPDTIALTVFGIAIPMITSVASFYVSFSTYSPLKNQMRTEEELIAENREYLRRMDAYITEYDLDADFCTRLLEDDEEKYAEMLNYHRALALTYCEYVREKLQESLADPSAISLISHESFAELLMKLDTEIEALKRPLQEENKKTDEYIHSKFSIGDVA